MKSLSKFVICSLTFCTHYIKYRTEVKDFFKKNTLFFFLFSDGLLMVRHGFSPLALHFQAIRGATHNCTDPFAIGADPFDPV